MVIRKAIFSASALVVGLGWGSAANGFFSYVPEPPAEEVAQSIPAEVVPDPVEDNALMVGHPVGVVQIGTGTASPVTGSVDGLPVHQALQMLVPTGWALATACGDTPVRWKSDGRDWLSVLSEVADRHQFAVEVDWGRQHIRCGDGEAAVSEVPEPEPVRLTFAVNDGSLRDNLVRFTEEQGWSELAWDLPSGSDWRVSGRYTVSGADLPELANALAEPYPVRICLYAINQVIRVVAPAATCQ